MAEQSLIDRRERDWGETPTRCPFDGLACEWPLDAPGARWLEQVNRVRQTEADTLCNQYRGLIAQPLAALSAHYRDMADLYYQAGNRLDPYTPAEPAPHPDPVWRYGWREPNHEPSAYNWIGYQRGKY